MQTLIDRYNGICVYCREPVDINVEPPASKAPSRDHFIPRSRGGARGMHNTVLACYDCNKSKGNMDPRRIIMAWLYLNPESFIHVVERIVEALDGEDSIH